MTASGRPPADGEELRVRGDLAQALLRAGHSLRFGPNGYELDEAMAVVEAHARRVAERVAERELRAAADIPLNACCPEHASKRLRRRAAALAAADDNEEGDHD